MCNSMFSMHVRCCLSVSRAVPNHMQAIKCSQRWQKNSFSDSRRFSASEVKVKPFREIPGPKGLPFLGVVQDFIKYAGKSNDLYEQYYRQYGEIVKLKVIGEYQVVLYNPDHIAAAFRAEPKFPKRQAIDSWKMWRERNNLPYSITMVNGHDWKKYRQSLNKLLQPDVVASYVPRIDAVALDWVALIEDQVDSNGNIIELREFINRFTSEAISVVLAGYRVGLLEKRKTLPEKTRSYLTSVGRMFDTSYELMFSLPIWRFYDTDALKRHFAAWQDMFDGSKRIIDEAAGKKHFSDGVENFLDHVREAEGHKLTPQEVLMTSVEITAAGVDTTAQTMQFVLLNLSQNPHAQQKLRAEIDAVMGDTKNITADHWKKMKYLKNCVTESMRLLPVFSNNGRHLEQPLYVGGYEIPAGVPLVLSTWTAGRSDANFRDALTYRPERHEDENYNSFASLPFGAGARSCPGRRLALMEAEIALAHLVRNYEISFPYAEGPEISATISNSPLFKKSQKHIVWKKRV